jgi:hypothetical protein
MWFQTFNICACGAMEVPHDQMNLDDGIKTTSMQKKCYGEIMVLKMVAHLQ